MKVVRHGENLWQLTELFAFSCYLVRNVDHGLTLVDAGLRSNGQPILAAAEEIGRPITRIILTHAHGDHVGALDDVAARLPHAEIAFTARTAAFLRGELALMPEEPQEKLRGSFVLRNTQPARVLTPDDMVGSLRVVAAPGHTPDLVAFYDERDGTLIAGDAFQTQAGTAVAGDMRWLFPFPALATWHKPTALQSAIALRRLNPARLAVGHGPVLAQPGQAMDAAIRRAESRATWLPNAVA